jgi:hypothetical protein
MTCSSGWYWFVPREQYCWLVAGGWFVLREKYCWLMADKSDEHVANLKHQVFPLIFYIFMLCMSPSSTWTIPKDCGEVRRDFNGGLLSMSSKHSAKAIPTSCGETRSDSNGHLLSKEIQSRTSPAVWCRGRPKGSDFSSSISPPYDPLYTEKHLSVWIKNICLSTQIIYLKQYDFIK